MTTTQKPTVTPAITGEIDLQNALHILPASLQPWRPSLMSYIASLFSTIVGFPLDSVKTRMQTHHFKGVLDCLRQTVHEEGLRGFFRGLSAPLLSTSITKAIGVGAYSHAKPYASLLQKYTIRPIIVDEDASRSKQGLILAINNAPVSFAAGMFTGAVCTFFACPFEFTKLFQQICLLQQHDLGLSPKKMPRTTYEVVKQVRRSEGFGGLYSGFRYHLLRDSVGTALYFSIYETAKILINGLATDEGMIGNTNIPMGTVSVTLAGAISGVLSYTILFPIDTVKSLTQRDIISNIIRGLALKPRQPVVLRSIKFPTREMYRGLSVSLFRAVLTSAAFFSGFEYLMNHIA